MPNPPLSPTPPQTALTFLWSHGELSQLWLLLPAERIWVNPKRNSGRRGSSTHMPSPSHPSVDAAPDLGPSRACSAARSVPVLSLAQEQQPLQSHH